MSEAIVVYQEAEQLVNSLFQYSLHDIGSSSFLKQHEVLQKLNMQAHHNIAHESEEFVSELLGTYSKYDTLVWNLLVLAMFRRALRARFLQFEFGSEETTLKAQVLLYAIEFDEAVILDLLCVRVVDQVFESQYLSELIDYAAECLNQVIANSYTYDYRIPAERVEPRDEMRFSAADLDFKRNITCFELIRGLSCNELALEEQYRLKTDRIEVKVAEVLALQSAPWVREVASNDKIQRVDVFEGLEWRPAEDLTALRFRLQQAQAQLYIALLGLARLNEQFTPAEIDVFASLKGRIIDSYMDEIAELKDLRLYYEKLALSQEQSDLQREQGKIQDQFGIDEFQTKPILVEVVSSVEAQIKEQGKRKVAATRGTPQSTKIESQIENGVISLSSAQSNAVTDQQLFEAVFDIVVARISAFDVTTNTVCDEYDKVFPLCICGKIARNRCAKCKKAWYCSRECQVKDWKSGHKQICVAPNQLDGVRFQ